MLLPERERKYSPSNSVIARYATTADQSIHVKFMRRNDTTSKNAGQAIPHVGKNKLPRAAFRSRISFSLSSSQRSSTKTMLRFHPALFLILATLPCLVIAQTAQKPDLAKQPTLYVVGYSHLDTEWRWEYPQVI